MEAGHSKYIAGYSYMYVPIKQAYLGNLAPDHARSSYMALYGMVYRGATFLGGLGVILGGMLSSWLIAIIDCTQRRNRYGDVLYDTWHSWKSGKTIILQRQILLLWKLIRLVWKALHKPCRLAPWL